MEAVCVSFLNSIYPHMLTINYVKKACAHQTESAMRILLNAHYIMVMITLGALLAELTKTESKTWKQSRACSEFIIQLKYKI